MNYLPTKQKYLEYGYYTLPTTEKKSPCVPFGQDWKEELPDEMFENCYGIGLKLGSVSGFIECMDFDNHMNNAKNKLSEYLSILEVKEIYEKHKLPVESTVSGGYHILYKCLEMEGSRKLALQLKEDKTTDCFIETKGLSSYICIDPTPGYKFIRNDFFNIPLLSKVERSILIDNAISMNEVFQSYKTEYEQTDRPGDLYNANMSAISDMKSILQSIGWQDLGNYRWRRPGKKEGISATLGKVAPNVFYVFTANSSPFEPNKAYSPFQVLALVRFNGDFKEAAKSIAPEKQERIETGKINLTELEKILIGAKIDTNRKIDRPPTILSFMDQQATQTIQKRVFTLGNFSCIIGKAKSKKTFFLSLVSSALLCNSSNGKFIGEMKQGKDEILYFDTEQGEYDSYNVIKRIEHMAGTRDRLRGYNLRPFSPNDRCQIIEYAFKLYGEKTGFCVIDGIADLANGINDEDEATRVVTLLLRLTKVHNCHISTIIHQNKNNEFATGHLGSSIMKKAEIIISVNKRENDISEITCDMSRGIGFESFDMYINPDGLPEINRQKYKKEPIPTYYEPNIEDIPF